MMGKVKEATEVEAEFAASQAPWNKLVKKQEKSKSHYFDLSKKVRLTIATVGELHYYFNSSGDLSCIEHADCFVSSPLKPSD